MTLKKILSVSIFAFLLVLKLVAQGDVITAKQFIELQKNTDNLVVIDASKPKLYQKAHIKGAINIPYAALNEPETDDNVFGMLLPLESMEKFLGDKGVGHSDMIVVYDEGSQKYSTRVYWVLKYLGAQNVNVLHKDNIQWRKARIKLTSKVTKLDVKTFTASLDMSIASDIDFVENNMGNPEVVLIDARSVEEFLATNTEKYSMGHLVESINIPFTSVLNEDKSFKSSVDLELIIVENTLSKDKKYIVYCKSGIKAAIVFTALKTILKFPDVTIYDGGYLEWEAYEMPLVK